MKVLLTYGIGPEHEQLLDYTLPSKRRFARWHGYELVVAAPQKLDLPASWHKIALLLKWLPQGDVLWLDSDVLVCDTREDVVPAGDMRLALTQGHPNCGVWWLRSCKANLDRLRAVWERRRKFAQHVWWEQAALLDLWDWPNSGIPQYVELLGSEWNYVGLDERPRNVRFLHAAGQPEKLEFLRTFLSSHASVA